MARRSDIDWDAIEREYRMGVKTNRQLATDHGVQASSIGRRAEKNDWTQDKSAEVRLRAGNMLVRATANATKNATGNATPSAIEIKAAATVLTDTVLNHRVGLARLTRISAAMLNEIEAQTSALDMLAEIIEIARNPDENGQDKRNDLLQRVIALPSRVDSLKKLTEIDEKIRKGEREAFSITSEPGGEVNAVASLLSTMGRSSLPVTAEGA